MKIFSTFLTVNISKHSNMHCCELHLNNFKDDFLNILIFLHPQIPDIHIVEHKAVQCSSISKVQHRHIFSIEAACG